MERGGDDSFEEENAMFEGRWIVAHVHSSVPFDTATGKASLDLQP